MNVFLYEKNKHLFLAIICLRCHFLLNDVTSSSQQAPRMLTLPHVWNVLDISALKLCLQTGDRSAEFGDCCTTVQTGIPASAYNFAMLLLLLQASELTSRMLLAVVSFASSPKRLWDRILRQMWLPECPWNKTGRSTAELEAFLTR